MSTTTEDFESTPLIIGSTPTTYGDLRRTAQSTLQTTTEENVLMAAALSPKVLTGALKGLNVVVLALLDVIEGQTNNNAEE